MILTLKCRFFNSADLCNIKEWIVLFFTYTTSKIHCNFDIQSRTRWQWNSNSRNEVNCNSLVVMRLKIWKQCELNFVSRIIQWPWLLETVPFQWGKEEAPQMYLLIRWESRRRCQQSYTKEFKIASCHKSHSANASGIVRLTLHYSSACLTKKPFWFLKRASCFKSGSTYSPTQSPMQYHRRERA